MAEPVAPEQGFRCRDCGAKINEGEAKVFGVCDACWEKAYPPVAKPIDADELRNAYSHAMSGEACPTDCSCSIARCVRAVPMLLDVLVAVTRERDDLKRVINEDQDCSPRCNEHAHDDDCPRINTSIWLTRERARREAAEARVAKLEAALAMVPHLAQEDDGGVVLVHANDPDMEMLCSRLGGRCGFVGLNIPERETRNRV